MNVPAPGRLRSQPKPADPGEELAVRDAEPPEHDAGNAPAGEKQPEGVGDPYWNYVPI